MWHFVEKKFLHRSSYYVVATTSPEAITLSKLKQAGRRNSRIHLQLRW